MAIFHAGFRIKPQLHAVSPLSVTQRRPNAFEICSGAINKDVVRRILIQNYRPPPGGGGPFWLSVIGQARDSLWSVDLFRCESIRLKSYWVMVVMDIFTRRIIAAANLDGPGVCRMFNRRPIMRPRMPKHLSSDHDPLFRFQRWLANLRILEIDEIKSIPGTPRSHAFIERLIGTIRREYLDQTFLARKLNTRFTTTDIAATPDWPASRQLTAVARLPMQLQTLTHTAGENTATASFRPRPSLEWYFATHKLRQRRERVGEILLQFFLLGQRRGCLGVGNSLDRQRDTKNKNDEVKLGSPKSHFHQAPISTPAATTSSCFISTNPRRKSDCVSSQQEFADAMLPNGAE